MPVVETLDEAIRNLRSEAAESTSEQFGSAVRAMLITEDGNNPKIIGSCTLINVDGRRFAITAGHVLDEAESFALYLAGTEGTEPLQILGEAFTSRPPIEGRKSDKIDLAFWEVENEAAEKLGDVSFIMDTHFSRNEAAFENRIYMALGYPYSKNKKNIDNAKKTIKTSLAKYTAELDNNPEVAAAYGVSGSLHLFLKYHKYSETVEREKIVTFEPKGLSGGPLFDLGNFATISRFESGVEQMGNLAGMTIERTSGKKVLVAVRIGVIVNAIRRHYAP